MQEVWHGRVWSARPLTVVEDTAERLALWWLQGTRWKAPTTPPERERAPTRTERFDSMFALRDWVFLDADSAFSNLILVRPGDWHEVRVVWDEHGDFRGWYVNFQRPIVCTQSGLQTMDLMLDIVVESGRPWRWKDEDEFETLTAAGHIEEAEAEGVRHEAASVITRIEAGASPFNEPWRDWQPEPAWPIPRLSPGWDRVES